MAKIYAGASKGKTFGTEFADEIYGTTGGDFIVAGGGNDVVDAGAGDDVIVGGSGADKINGGDGTDTVSYQNAPGGSGPFGPNTGVYVRLDTGTGNFSDASGDTFSSVENVIGSNYDDTIYGNDANNVLHGLAGDDMIHGGAGADTMDGGTGVDILDYLNNPASPTGVTVNLLNNTASGGHAQGDTILNFEGVQGTNLSDTITGSNDDNYLHGAGSSDVLYGLGGSDHIIGGQDSDGIDGGSGNDTIVGGTGDDKLIGGLDADTFVFDVSGATWGYGGFQSPGDDHILDFEDGIDCIRFNVQDAANGMSELTITQVGTATVITYDNSAGSLTLHDFNASQLSAADFEFV
jgi:Ca2+-binding RTX toxin-like protein